MYKWLHHYAFNSKQKNYFSFLKIFLLYFDIRPKLFINSLCIALLSRRKNISKIGFVHIPKNAGTYINSLKTQFPFLNFNHVLGRDDRSDKFCPVGLTPIKINKLKNYFLFSSIRNPFSFFVSYYHHVIGNPGHENLNHYDYKVAIQGFEPFLKSITNRNDKWPSRKFLFPQLFDQGQFPVIDYLIRNETIHADLESLFALYNCTYIKKEKQRAAVKNELSYYYSQELIDLVNDIYSRELFLFGYTFDSYALPELNLKDFKLNNVRYCYESDTIFLNGKELR